LSASHQAPADTGEQPLRILADLFVRTSKPRDAIDRASL
jgi:hypothetical protein